MCRLLAYVADRPTTARAVLGAEAAAAYQHLGALHRDGWGTVWVDPDGHLQRRRTPRPGDHDPELTTTLTRRTARARVVHLRLATAGLANASANTHPFVGDGLGFAHNGSIVPTDALRRLVDPELAATIDGTTDSEWYFALIRHFVRRGAHPVHATAQAVSAIRQHYPAASLNALLLTHDHLIVVHSNEGAPVPWEHFRTIDGGALPDGHDDGYYRLSYRSDSAGFAVASTGFATPGWHTVPQDCLVTVRLADRRVDVLDLDDADALYAAA